MADATDEQEKLTNGTVAPSVQCKLHSTVQGFTAHAVGPGGRQWWHPRVPMLGYLGPLLRQWVRAGNLRLISREVRGIGRWPPPVPGTRPGARDISGAISGVARVVRGYPEGSGVKGGYPAGSGVCGWRVGDGAPACNAWGCMWLGSHARAIMVALAQGMLVCRAPRTIGDAPLT